MIIEFNRLLFNRIFSTFLFYNKTEDEIIDIIIDDSGSDEILWDNAENLLFDDGSEILY